MNIKIKKNERPQRGARNTQAKTRDPQMATALSDKTVALTKTLKKRTYIKNRYELNQNNTYV